MKEVSRLRSLAWPFALAWSLCMVSAFGAAPPLPHLGLKADSVTVSGLSSGGYMATQFGVAYSASIAGVGVIAGGPYGCARGSATTATTLCSCLVENVFRVGCVDHYPDFFLGADEEETSANQGHIDGVTYLKRQKIWLQSGTRDGVVNPTLVDAVRQYYLHFGVPAAQIGSLNVPGAGHGFITPLATQACGATSAPYLNKCPGVDTAANVLTWLYPDLQGLPRGSSDSASLIRVDQRAYLPHGAWSGMDDSGWLYVPRSCTAEPSRCRLHVVFHGCEQAQASVDASGNAYGTTFVRGSGYLEWAETGGIVLLFPQVKPANGLPGFKYNPKGCWDFWGYTDKYADLHADAPYYARKSAPQMKAVKAMIEALLQPP